MRARRLRGFFAIGALILFASCAVNSDEGVAERASRPSDGDDTLVAIPPTVTPTATAAPTPTSTPVPTATPEPSPTPVPTPTPDLSLPLIEMFRDDLPILGLIEDCRDEIDMACDVLRARAGDAENLEQFAKQCGGRKRAIRQFCTGGVQGVTVGSIPFSDYLLEVEQVGEQCEDGDMTACDFLYFRSDSGSVWQELGKTCAARTEQAVPDCRTAFADS